MEFFKALIPLVALQGTEKISLGDAIERASHSLSKISEYHGALIAPEIDAYKVKLVNAVIEEAGVSQSLTQEQIGRAVKRIVTSITLGEESSLNELPSSLGAIQTLFNTFYLYCEKQTNGWTCGWRAILAALGINSLLAQNKPLSNTSIATCVANDILDCAVLKPFMTNAPSVDEKVKACIALVQERYKNEKFIKETGVDPQDSPGIKRSNDKVNDLKAEDHHLINLAHEFLLNNFYVLGSGKSPGGTTFHFELEGGRFYELYYKVYEDLLNCAGEKNKIESWMTRFLIESAEVAEKIRQSCKADAVVLAQLIDEYKEHDFIKNNPQLNLGEKLEKILDNSKKNTLAQAAELQQCLTLESLKKWVQVHRDLGRVQQFLEAMLRKRIREDFQRNNTVDALHFVFHLSDYDHWMLLSIVKRKDRKPVMLILDSYNFDINNSSDACRCIQYVYSHFLMS